MASPQAAKPLAEQVSEQMKEYIMQHQLKAHEKLPTEAKLAEMMGVGRSTIREALKLLASRNILEVRHGSGTFVSDHLARPQDPLNLSFIHDKQRLSKDLLEIRMIIEPPIAAMAARNATEADIEELLKLYAELEELVLAKKHYIPVDILFHQRIAQASRNIVVPSLTPIIAQAIELFTSRTKGKLMQETVETHKAVLDAILRQDSAAAQDAMILHLIYNRNLLRQIEEEENRMEKALLQNRSHSPQPK